MTGCCWRGPAIRRGAGARPQLDHRSLGRTVEPAQAFAEQGQALDRQRPAAAHRGDAQLVRIGGEALFRLAAEQAKTERHAALKKDANATIG